MMWYYSMDLHTPVNMQKHTMYVTSPCTYVALVLGCNNRMHAHGANEAKMCVNLHVRSYTHICIMGLIYAPITVQWTSKSYYKGLYQYATIKFHTIYVLPTWLESIMLIFWPIILFNSSLHFSLSKLFIILVNSSNKTAQKITLRSS